jgi:hypothetical protein
VTSALVQALATSPGVGVYVAQVLAVGADETLTLTLAGGSVSGVARLASYAAPAVGDVVYVLSTGTGSMVVLGAEVPRVPPPPLPESLPAVEVQASVGATYTRDDQTWTPGPVTQDPGHVGAFFYPAGALSALFQTPVQAIEIQLMTEGPGPLNLALMGNPAPAGQFVPLSPPHLVTVTAGVMGWVRLPLAWAGPLTNGNAGGVALISDTDTALVTDGGTLRVTPL